MWCQFGRGSRATKCDVASTTTPTSAPLALVECAAKTEPTCAGARPPLAVCVDQRPISPPPLAARALPACALSDYLERRVRRAAPGAALQNTTVRVLCVRDMAALVPDGLRGFVGGEQRFDMRLRCVGLFQEIDGVDVLCFITYWRESPRSLLAADAPDTEGKRRNAGHAQLTYLDSAAHRALVAGQLEWLRARGNRTVSVWACPPVQGDDYVLRAKPFNPLLGEKPTAKSASQHLTGWYRRVAVEARGKLSDAHATFVEGSRSRGTSLERLPFFDDEPWIDSLKETLCPAKVAVHLKKYARELLVIQLDPMNPTDADDADGLARAVEADDPAMGEGGPFDDRARLLALQRQKDLRFDTLPHAKYATMSLLACQVACL